MGKSITNADVVHTMVDSNTIFGNFGGEVGQIPISDFREHLNDNDEEVLHNLAFYIDVNKASSLGSTRVDVGGNMNMRQLWENAAISVLMDANGNYCELNRNDNRYTAEGDYLLNSDGTVISQFAHCDFMKIIPQTYGRVQTITVGAVTVLRLWLSLVPLPGGYIIPMQVVGKFKATFIGSGASAVMRSLPGLVPANTRTVRGFWENAQLRSKSHGLANLDFRNHLLFHMMAKYAWRDSQNCKGSDNTLVWGVGLDGTEGLASGQSASSDGFNNQKNIKTGHSLSLGDFDGKVAVACANSNTAHGVSVAGFENPWGQYWEMMGSLCSVGTDVYCWRGNIVPNGTPTAETFANMDCVQLTRPTSAVWGMNIIASEQGQGVYMIPKQSVNGISYGDNFYYAADGQLWLFGGYSNFGSNCGLACSASNAAWSASSASFSARLAYYGAVNRVSANRLAELAS